MGFLSNIFGGKQEQVEEKPIHSYADFWDWFRQHEQAFAGVIKANGNIEKKMFDVIRPRLHAVDENLFYLLGISDDIIEFIVTADGKFKSMVSAEELVQEAPAIAGWKFTALKPANDSGINISAGGFDFNENNIFFYANEHDAYLDEIDITIVHEDYRDDQAKDIAQGVYLYLDNYLGELQFVSTIDNMSITGRDNAKAELVPIAKLKEYITWREKEFVEKYESTRRDTTGDKYAVLQGQLETGLPMVASINTEVLKWDSKASHPWILAVTMHYNGNHDGMPDDATIELMATIEEDITAKLAGTDGYINIGRQTADNARELYYACKDFRTPARVLRDVEKQYTDKADISFEVYKDKYWQSFERFGEV